MAGWINNGGVVLCGGEKINVWSFTCRLAPMKASHTHFTCGEEEGWGCNKDGFHGDSRGVGMVMVSLTRRLSMTMSRPPLPPFFFSSSSSTHQLRSVSDSHLEKTEGAEKLDQLLKDEVHLF